MSNEDIRALEEESPKGDDSNDPGEEQESLGTNSGDDTENGDPQEESDPSGGGFYKPEGRIKKFGGRSNANKALIVGGPTLAALILFAIFMLLIGSLKAVHFSTILRTAGFAASQNVMRKSFTEIGYADWALENNTAELPKSKLKEKIFSDDMRAVQKQLAEEGKFKYTVDKAGNTTGFEVNGEKVVFDELAQRLGTGKKSFSELGYREKLTVKKYLSEKIKFEIPEVHDVGTRSFRNGFWKGFRNATGIKMRAFDAKLVDKFGKGTLNDNADTDEARLRGEDVRGPKIGSTIPEVDESNTAIADAFEESFKNNRRIKLKEALKAHIESKGGTLDGFETKLGQASGAVALSSLYCIAHDLSGTSDRINKQLEESMARFGHRQQTTVDQIKSGDVTSGDVAFASKEWGGDEETPDASASKLYQQAIGENPDNQGLEDVPRMNISLPLLDWFKPIDRAIKSQLTLGLSEVDPTNTVDKLLNKELDAGCAVVMNPVGQGIVLVVDVGFTFVSGGLSAAVETGLKAGAFFAGGAVFGKVVESYIKQASGASISGQEIGSERYDASAVSTDYLNSQTSRGTTFGRPESADESSSSKAVAMAELHNHYRNQGIKDRYFAITNPDSVLGLAVAKIPSTASSVAMAVVSLPKNIGLVFSGTFSTIGSVFGSSKVLAANSQDVSRANDYFGVQQWGWSTEELDELDKTNVIDNANAVEQDMEKDSSYYTTLEKCYTSGRLLYELARDDNCKTDALGTPRALQWRIYKLHEFTVNQMASQDINDNQ